MLGRPKASNRKMRGLLIRSYSCTHGSLDPEARHLRVPNKIIQKHLMSPELLETDLATGNKSRPPLPPIRGLRVVPTTRSDFASNSAGPRGPEAAPPVNPELKHGVTC